MAPPDPAETGQECVFLGPVCQSGQGEEGEGGELEPETEDLLRPHGWVAQSKLLNLSEPSFLIL